MIRDQALRLLPVLALAVIGGSNALDAQQPASLPPETVPLTDGSSFAALPGGWRIVGGAGADRSRDYHIATEGGSGVLVNVADSGEGENLVTAWEHGDLDLELEFMMPKGSNSGIYFQGRYELQLLDSWRVQDPTYGDVGGIYQRWEETRGAGREGFEGHAPRVNAARAPGLWQTLRVEFRAPRFDTAGRKVANARFALVELNGAVLHENIELTGPTRGASLPGEAATGPIVIQGDHGPVAFRDIRYKRYGAEPLRLSDLRYRAYEGTFVRLPETSALTATRTGSAMGLTATAAGVADAFALVHEGMIDVPAAGRYLFDLRLEWVDPDNTAGDQGGARLVIGGREVLVHDGRGRSETAEVQLPAGRHPFLLEIFKNREGRPASFALFAEGPGVRRMALHTETSFPRGTAAGPIRVEPTGEPVVLRSFVQHGDEKRTHVVSVGDPAEIHYSYDAELGSILQAWRGPFLETTQMWEGRGEPQLARPLGSVLELGADPSVALLRDAGAAWPDSMVEGANYRFLGYDMDRAGRPTFRYRLNDVTIEDQIRPAGEGRGLARAIRASAPGDVGAYHVRLASGESIERQGDGSYLVDGEYYLVPTGGLRGLAVRAAAGGQELIVPLAFRGGAAAVEYEIVW